MAFLQAFEEALTGLRRFLKDLFAQRMKNPDEQPFANETNRKALRLLLPSS